jgi:hypothetical protein
MNVAEYRKIALRLPGTEERAHMNHPDFRVGGKIFATLGYPKPGWAMIKLTPEQQAEFLEENPGSFLAVKGKWGVQGCTNVLLENAKEATVERALKAAWLNHAPHEAVEQSPKIREAVVGSKGSKRSKGTAKRRR